jgi:sulfate transport system substrate-binding protein
MNGSKRRFGLILFGWLVALGLLTGCNGSNSSDELLNVSDDPTRELWKDLNAAFIAQHTQETGKKISIKQSHGGSGSQARAVIDGLDADVVTLALWTDVDAIRKKGLIDDGWQKKLPHDSLPYYSTIVFVVRKGNPKGIKDWKDLAGADVSIITPNPRTSGNGRLSLLAAWASVIRAGGTEAEALDFLTRIYRRVPVLDTGARGSSVTFTQRKIGDVHLTWENEAHQELAEAKGELEIVYPKASIRAEPFVAVVDANVDRKKTRELAEKYLNWVYSDEAQEILARHAYRPINDSIRKKHADIFPELDLVPITVIAKDWGDAHQKFFGSGGIYDRVQEALKQN